MVKVDPALIPPGNHCDQWVTEALDAAVAAAYGWADYTPQLSDDDILARLLALNLQRAGGGL